VYRSLIAYIDGKDLRREPLSHDARDVRSIGRARRMVQRIFQSVREGAQPDGLK